MLNITNIHSPQTPFDDEVAAPSQFSLRWMLGTVFRFKRLIALISLVAVAFAIIFVLTRPATYTATAHLQLTNLRLTFSRDDAFFAETQLDPTFIETQIQIMRSERIALAVVDNLKLPDQPQESRGGGLSAIIGELGMMFAPRPPDAGVAGAMSDPKAAALKMVQRGLSAERVSLSNVVELKFTAPDADQAARITNDIVRAYIVDQNMARIDAAQSGSSWLRERLREVGPKTRIIAAAMPPADKSNVRGILIIAVAGILGGAAAVTFALVMAFLDRSVRTPEQAAEATRSPFLGVVPVMPLLNKSATKAKPNKELLLKGAFQIPPAALCAIKAVKQNELWHTLRNARFASDENLRGGKFQVIGVASLIRGEGCTTIASNLAISLATAGKRTLLVDGDIYTAGLSRRFGLAEERGLIEYGTGRQSDLNKFVKIDQETGLHFLPSGAKHGMKSLEWLDKMPNLIAGARETYDYVIFDLPPLTMPGDIRAATKFIDGILLVVGWGNVSVEHMQVGLSMAHPVHSKLIGCILNKIDMGSMRWIPSRELDFIRLRKKSVQGQDFASLPSLR
ncbi:Wzz/FepE/Etk N-terminal domain-containing protein [Bosea sp. 124]|uniref:Wzz/FepE/Etk N-terminal domain-containing protein n=1 Tax=Bosea sp. 124 TaxID=2135642 RepID=UPI000D375FB3|nr:Wzz/FepE/Etk N-terminal domain-containing protein [Bosea sp. 124]PTM41489.1 Mrp family chromosome partitioning ATPase [Bosea sp. 124]